jgi:anti-sigma regulatory factor (Ser/Thr protein kinase)
MGSATAITGSALGISRHASSCCGCHHDCYGRGLEGGEQTECFKGKELEVETALREALANAVIHGGKNDERQWVHVSVSCDRNNEVKMVVRDSCYGFDPKSVPDPTLGQNLLATHGRGLFLIRQFMDEVRHERGGTEIFMRKR